MGGSADSERLPAFLPKVVLPKEPFSPANSLSIDQVLKKCEEAQQQLADMHLKLRLEKYKKSLTPSQDPHKKRAYQ